MHRFFLTVTLAALLAGCGLKGPLYYPGQKPAPKQSAKPAPTPTPTPPASTTERIP
jgi:predicted small lipoprotein YifL